MSRPPIKSFRDLQAWQKSYSFALQVYKATKHLPVDERFGLSLQLRRGGVSVASNIAEGYGRGGRADYVRFLKIARGALYELETQLAFCSDLGYFNADLSSTLYEQLAECQRVLGGLIRSLEGPARPSTS